MSDGRTSNGLPFGRVFTSFLGLGMAASILTTHVAVLVFLSSSVVPSNICQLLAPAFAMVVCWVESRRFKEAYHRRLWGLLVIAFAMWTIAQGYFLVVLLRSHVLAPFPSLADLLWLLVAFPVLLVIVTRRSGSETDWVSWIDAAQAPVGKRRLVAPLLVPGWTKM